MRFVNLSGWFVLMFSVLTILEVLFIVQFVTDMIIIVTFALVIRVRIRLLQSSNILIIIIITIIHIIINLSWEKVLTTVATFTYFSADPSLTEVLSGP